MGLIPGEFQVLGFAAFFASVLKREDEDDTVPFLPRYLRGPGNGALVGGALVWLPGGLERWSMPVESSLWGVLGLTDSQTSFCTSLHWDL